MGLLGAVWGLSGVLFLVGYAVLRLTPVAAEAFSSPLTWPQWLLLIINTAFAVSFKGHIAFQKGLSPRVAARARYLRDHPRLPHLLLAPLFCMGYFHIERRKQIVTFATTGAMVGLIILVRQFEQPWRGLIDVGIVAALSWGFITLLFFGVQALTQNQFRFGTYISETATD